MNMDFARGTAAGIAACLVAGGLALAVGAANAQSTPQAVSAATSGVVKACANKRTGALRLLAKGKCKKTERLVTWNQAGPVGPAGPSGAAGAAGPAGAGAPVVRDGNGNVVTGVTSAGSHFVVRLVDGGFWSYHTDGTPSVQSGLNVTYSDAECTVPVTRVDEEDTGEHPQARWVIKLRDGRVAAYAATGTLLGPGPSPLYVWDEPGVCEVKFGWEKTRFRALQEVPRPPDLVGPLTVTTP